MIEEQQFLSDGLAATCADKTSGASPIVGLAGGKPPKRLNGVRFYMDSDKEFGPPSCKRSKLPLAPGDRYQSWTAGGAGVGDPLDRDPAQVAWDVLNEYVTAESAYEDYGVVLVGEDVDAAATDERRRKLRAAAS
jgi:N-methylhydantoinase B